MRGEVISVDGLSGDGLISGEDGARYTFAGASTRASLQPGDRVDFVPLDGAATEIMVMAGAARAASAAQPAAYAVNPGYDFGHAMFAFYGRLRRSHYWISWAILFGVGFVVGLIPVIGLFGGLLLMWPHLAVGAKRLHDMGKSGWLLAIPWGLMALAYVVVMVTVGVSIITDPTAFESEDSAAMLSTLGPSIAVMIVSWVVGIGFWLWMGIAESQPGRNRYGANPAAPDGDADVFV